jgi:predicted PurR-regulated permease PerM
LVVIIPILAFFFLKDAGVMRQHILDLVEDGPRRALLDEVMADLHLLLAHYMRALMMLSAAAFTAYSIFFSIVGVPYAILLGALGGLLEFIPMLGPLAAGVTIVVVGAVSGANVPLMIIFLLAYRVFQDYVLSPHLMGQGVEVHPLLVLFGVFAGAEVAGIPGTFLSVPVLAMVRIVYLRIRKARLGSQIASTRTPVGSVRL